MKLVLDSTTVVCVVWLLVMDTSTAAGERAEADHPIAIHRGRAVGTAIIAQERGGALVVVDYERGTVRQSLGRFGTLTDCDRLTSDEFLVTADNPPRLVIVSETSTGPAPREVPWPVRPTAVCVSPQGRLVAILNREDRRVDCLAVSTLTSQPLDRKRLRAVTLPFQPGRCLWLTDERHLVVADSYGGRLAVIDAVTGLVASLHSIPGHNIAGLALNPGGDRLYLTQQILHRGKSTTYDDIHWGDTLTNVLRSLSVADLVDPTADPLADAVTFTLGETGRATGDPASVVIREDGLLIVALAGVNEVAVDRGRGLDWKRVAVGARPTSITLAHDGQRALVTNTLDNTLSVIRLTEVQEIGRTISLGSTAAPTAADRGERLFFDARLSHDGWMSCHSCHPSGHTNNQLVDNLSDGTTDTAKRVPSLRGLRGTAPYAWDGRFATLADQVRHSVASTMQGQPLAEGQVQDLIAFLETVSVPQPSQNLPDELLIAAGKTVFNSHGCNQCHVAPLFTSAATYDVGLEDERGLQRFNPPSLRGLHAADRFLHDGRASRLEDVFRRQQHQLPAPLSEVELQALLAYLQSL